LALPNASLATLRTSRLEADTRAPTMSFAQVSPPDHGLGCAYPTTGKEVKLRHELSSVRWPVDAVAIDVQPDPKCKTTMAKS
jgi:hypothetical protein